MSQQASRAYCVLTWIAAPADRLATAYDGFDEWSAACLRQNASNQHMKFVSSSSASFEAPLYCCDGRNFAAGAPRAGARALIPGGAFSHRSTLKRPVMLPICNLEARPTPLSAMVEAPYITELRGWLVEAAMPEPAAHGGSSGGFLQ